MERRTNWMGIVTPLALGLLGSCGGGGGGGGAPTGAFLDSAVEGLSYDNGVAQGTTAAGGTFPYGAAMVQFGVGDIDLGMAAGAARVTPVDLVAGAVDEMNEFVTNRARFLLTLDDDADPANGILITPQVTTNAAGLSLNFDQTIAAFESDPAVSMAITTLLGVATPLVPAAAAQAHLRATLLGAQAGRYAGSYTGTDSGPWQFYLDRNGDVLGCGFSNFDVAVFFFNGTFTSASTGVLGVVSTGATYSGSITGSQVAGTWALAPTDSGTFAGNVTHPVAATLDPAILAQIAGNYLGTSTSGGSTDPFDLTVGVDGSLTINVAPDAAVGAIEATSAGGATMRGMDDEGTDFSGSFDLAGNLSGTLSNVHFAEFGTFTGVKQ